jgi:hypothetical protein
MTTLLQEYFTLFEKVMLDQVRLVRFEPPINLLGEDKYGAAQRVGLLASLVISRRTTCVSLGVGQLVSLKILQYTNSI